jgi:hypothetical protein
LSKSKIESKRGRGKKKGKNKMTEYEDEECPVRIVEVGGEQILNLDDVDVIRKENLDPKLRRFRQKQGLTLRFQFHLYGRKALDDCVYCGDRLGFLHKINDLEEKRGFYNCEACCLVYDLPLRNVDRKEVN